METSRPHTIPLYLRVNYGDNHTTKPRPLPQGDLWRQAYHTT